MSEKGKQREREREREVGGMECDFLVGTSCQAEYYGVMTLGSSSVCGKNEYKFCIATKQNAICSGNKEDIKKGMPLPNVMPHDIIHHAS